MADSPDWSMPILLSRGAGKAQVANLSTEVGGFLILASNSGIDPKLIYEVVGNGIAGNDYFRLLSKGILENTTSPGGMGQLWKDVSIVVNSGRQMNLPLLVATTASQYFMKDCGLSIISPRKG
jgi:3-hydroxyisobutyrate dehydrogenase-like beta-hydroxyacid dehydrogenase